MLEVYFTSKKEVYEKLKSAVARHICGTFEIKRTENGKPYIEGNPLFFSLSHSGERAVFVLSDEPVGIDLELYKDRNVSAIKSRFTEEITTQEEFYKIWVAKEAYIKMIGSTLAKDLKNLKFSDGALYYKNERKPIYFKHITGGICAISTQSEVKDDCVCYCDAQRS